VQLLNEPHGRVRVETSLLLEPQVADDRDDVQAGDRVLLIIEDDIHFADFLLDVAHEHGFKGLIAVRGEQGLDMARRFSPNAIVLDLNLPDVDGWTVLDRMKHDAKTRHIPVQVVSVEAQRWRGLRLGAVGYLEKPVSKDKLALAIEHIKEFLERPAKHLLVVESDIDQQKVISELIGNTDVKTTIVDSAEAALSELTHSRYDCVVVDWTLPDMGGTELVTKIRKDAGHEELPIIVYRDHHLSKDEESELEKMKQTAIVKDAQTPESLVAETTLFLHRLEENLPEAQKRILDRIHQTDPTLSGRKVLIVDDDLRNIFALTSILEQHKMQVVYAENGRDGIEKLKETEGIDVVLMDIMMPEMDGYEATRQIRSMPKFKDLPIVALTAKAMKGDREKCLEAGASDYISKPIDSEQLLSMLRVWLFR
ncbi:MAG TPA: response regulator, partial [Candidatus Obscuribacterales bacterium]